MFGVLSIRVYWRSSAAKLLPQSAGLSEVPCYARILALSGDSAGSSFPCRAPDNREAAFPVSENRID
jgi:hypothetical protein